VAVPDYQTLMLPVLKAAANEEFRVSDVVKTLAVQLGLNEEDRAEQLPSGQQRKFDKRIVLIDGDQLAELMIKYDVGCRADEALYLKKIDEDFFPD